jgi:hypothetical protein
VAASRVTCYGKAYRAVVVPSSSQDQRRPKPLRREVQASSAALEATGRAAAQQEYVGRAEAEAAAPKGRALPSADHQVAVVVEEPPQDSPGRPRLKPPRVGKARRDRLPVTRQERAAVIARKTPEPAGLVRLTQVPTTGARAQRAGDVRQAEKEPHGIAPNCGVLNDPRMVHRLFLKTPERIEALGWVCVRARLLWRWMERPRRIHVETTGNAWPGWDQQETTRPPAFMMLTTCARVLVWKVGPPRQLAQAVSAVQQP